MEQEKRARLEERRRVRKFLGKAGRKAREEGWEKQMEEWRPGASGEHHSARSDKRNEHDESWGPDGGDWGSELKSDLLEEERHVDGAGILLQEEQGMLSEASTTPRTRDGEQSLLLQLKKDPLNLALLSRRWRVLLRAGGSRVQDLRDARMLYERSVATAQKMAARKRKAAVREEDIHLLFGTLLFETVKSVESVAARGGDAAGGGEGWRDGLVATAEKALRAGLSVNPQHVPSLEALAMLKDQLGHTQVANEMYMRAAEVAKSAGTAMSVHGLTNWGGLLDLCGERVKAHKCLVAALKRDGTHVPALVNLAGLLSRGEGTERVWRAADKLWARALTLLREQWRQAESLRDTGAARADAASLEALEGELKQATCQCLEGLAWLRWKRRGDIPAALRMLHAARTMAPCAESQDRINSAIRHLDGSRGRGSESGETFRLLQEPTHLVEAHGEKGGRQIGSPGPWNAEEEGEGKERAQSPVIMNQLAFFGGKLRERMSHILDAVGSPLGGGGMVSEVLKAAREFTGRRIFDTPPPRAGEVARALGTGNGAGEEEKRGLDGESSGKDLSFAASTTAFEGIPSAVSGRELGRSSPAPAPEGRWADGAKIGPDGELMDDPSDPAADYHPGFARLHRDCVLDYCCTHIRLSGANIHTGFLRSSEAVGVGESEPEPLYVNGEFFSGNSIDNPSSAVDRNGEHKPSGRRAERRAQRRLPKDQRPPDPLKAKFGFTLPSPPPEVTAKGEVLARSQFAWSALTQSNVHEEREHARARERVRVLEGRACTPALRVPSPEIGLVARNALLTSTGIKVCVEAPTGGKVLAAGLLRVLGRNLVVRHEGDVMSPFKFVRGCGFNASVEDVRTRILNLKTKQPVFEELGISVSAIVPRKQALESSEMVVSESELAGGATGTQGYVTPALEPASYVGSHGWHVLQGIAAPGGAQTSAGELQADEVEHDSNVPSHADRDMPTPPPLPEKLRELRERDEAALWQEHLLSGDAQGGGSAGSDDAEVAPALRKEAREATPDLDDTLVQGEQLQEAPSDIGTEAGRARQTMLRQGAMVGQNSAEDIEEFEVSESSGPTPGDHGAPDGNETESEFVNKEIERRLKHRDAQAARPVQFNEADANATQGSEETGEAAEVMMSRQGKANRGQATVGVLGDGTDVRVQEGDTRKGTQRANSLLAAKQKRTKEKIGRMNSVAVGCRFYLNDTSMQALKAGMPLKLVRQANNTHDRNAIRVELGEGSGADRLLGYLPKSAVCWIAPLVDAGAILISARLKPVPLDVQVPSVLSLSISIYAIPNQELALKKVRCAARKLVPVQGLRVTVDKAQLPDQASAHSPTASPRQRDSIFRLRVAAKSLQVVSASRTCTLTQFLRELKS